VSTPELFGKLRHGLGLFSVAELAPQPRGHRQDLDQLLSARRTLTDHVCLVVPAAFEHHLAGADCPLQKLDSFVPCPFPQRGECHFHDFKLMRQSPALCILSLDAFAALRIPSFSVRTVLPLPHGAVPFTFTIPRSGELFCKTTYGRGFVFIIKLAPQSRGGRQDLGQLLSARRTFSDHVCLVVPAPFERHFPCANRTLHQFDSIPPFPFAQCM
jgi:hypothetical protein